MANSTDLDNFNPGKDEGNFVRNRPNPMERSGNPNVKTREIRWFFQEERPGILALFEGLQPDQVTVETRRDDYLCLPEKEDLGIKIRQGRLEFKYRTQGPQPPENALIAGKEECWEKLGFELKQGAIPPVLETHSEAFWVQVTKHRWVTMVRATDGELHFSPPGRPYPESVQVEYTRLGVKGQEWHTSGFEWSSGQPLGLPESFLKRWVVPEGLSEANSMGYPAFLSRLAHGR